MKFYGQKGEDRYVFENMVSLGLPQRGFFADVGAADGIRHSNTYFFERVLHWRGVLIEPDARHHAALQRNRRVPVFMGAIGMKDGRKFFKDPVDPTLSG